MPEDAKLAAGRAFVRSLNVLLKFVRLYGLDHTRTAEQLSTSFNELRAALPADGKGGLLLGSSGAQLLLDGAPLSSTPAERSFAQLLTAAGLASIQFLPNVSREDLGLFARAFPVGRSKPSELAEQLKAELALAQGIRVNEVRFVAEDAGFTEARAAAELTARTLGAGSEQFKAWLNDPQKLLELIAAAEGAKSPTGSGSAPGGGNGPGPGGGSGGGTSAGSGVTSAAGAGYAGSSGSPSSGQQVSSSGTGDGSATGSPGDAEILRVFRLLSHLGAASQRGLNPSVLGPLREEAQSLPAASQDVMRQALTALAAQGAAAKPDQNVLLRLAEHLSIRFALERFERGEVRVNAVRQMLDRMGQEIAGLRKILGLHEEKMAQAGLLQESYVDMLDRQFWEQVPDAGKRSVLLSGDAWCIPPRNVRQYVEELRKRGDSEHADAILANYAAAISNEEADARKRGAIGIGELAESFASAGAKTFLETIRRVGATLAAERDAELHDLEAAAFVRLSQEAAARRVYAAVQQALASLGSIENQRPAAAQSIRARIGFETRASEFIEDTLRAGRIPDGLPEVLALMPLPAANQLTWRFSRCGYRKDSDLIIELLQSLGPDAVTHLRSLLRAGPPAEAVETVGLLTRLDPASLEEWLGARLAEWPRALHDRVVRQIAMGGAPHRGQLLMNLLTILDPLIRSMAVDEIGMSGDSEDVAPLLRLLQGDATNEHLRLKAAEALGRIRAQAAAPALRQIVESRKVLGWAHPQELRIVAAQSLARIQPDWAAASLARAGLDSREMSLAPLDTIPGSPCVRQRRYPRIKLFAHLLGTATTQKESCRFDIGGLSLGGGIARTDRRLAPGTSATLRIQASWRSVRATILIRDSHADIVAFEIVDMDHNERYKLRRLLASLAPANALSQESSAPSPGTSPATSEASATPARDPVLK